MIVFLFSGPGGRFMLFLPAADQCTAPLVETLELFFGRRPIPEPDRRTLSGARAGVHNQAGNAYRGRRAGVVFIGLVACLGGKDGDRA